MKKNNLKNLKIFIYFFMIIFLSSCKILENNSEKNISEKYLNEDLDRFYLTTLEENNF